MESKSFPSNFDIAGRFAKHRKQHYLRYGEQGYHPTIANYLSVIAHYMLAIAIFTISSSRLWHH